MEPGRESIEVDGRSRVSTVFRWKTGRRDHVDAQAVERPSELGWTGKTFGARPSTSGRSSHAAQDPSTTESFRQSCRAAAQRGWRRCSRRQGGHHRITWPAELGPDSRVIRWRARSFSSRDRHRRLRRPSPASRQHRHRPAAAPRSVGARRARRLAERSSKAPDTGSTSGRRLPESNRRKRLCRPLRNHSAKAPAGQA